MVGQRERAFGNTDACAALQNSGPGVVSPAASTNSPNPSIKNR